MTKVPLYSIRKTINFTIGSIGVVGIIFTFTNLFGFQAKWSTGIFPVFLINFYQYFIFKKQFFHIDQKSIEWKFPEFKDAKKVEIQSEHPEVSFNWKGVNIKDGEHLHKISLDGLWKKDRNRIQVAMEKVFGSKNAIT